MIKVLLTLAVALVVSACSDDSPKDASNNENSANNTNSQMPDAGEDASIDAGGDDDVGNASDMGALPDTGEPVCADFTQVITCDFAGRVLMGDTTGGPDIFQACTQNWYEGPENIWEFRHNAWSMVTFSIAFDTEQGDLDLYRLTGFDGCALPEGDNCRERALEEGPTETITFSHTPGEPSWVVAAPYQSMDGVAYTLEVSCDDTVCGDGAVLFEECDDGNTTPGDGCDENCFVEDGFACERQANGPSICTAVVCGDGERVGPEECDDGNEESNDGCVDCRIEFGFSCTNDPFVCTPRPDAGTFAPGEAIPEQTGGPIPGQRGESFMIEFSGDVLLSGTATQSGGDIDIRIYDEDRQEVFAEATDANNEAWTDAPLPAGRYQVNVLNYALDPITSYTVQLSTSAP